MIDGKILCKQCNHIGDESSFELSERHPTMRHVFEVGMICPKCRKKNVSFYTNKTLIKRADRVDRLKNERSPLYGTALSRYRSKFNLFQRELAMVEVNGGSRILRDNRIG